MAMHGVEVDDLTAVVNNNTKMGNGSAIRNVDPKEINAEIEYPAELLDEQPDSEIVKFFAGQAGSVFHT